MRECCPLMDTTGNDEQLPCMEDQLTEASLAESSEAAMLDFWLSQTNAEWEGGGRLDASCIDVSFGLTNMLFYVTVCFYFLS